MKLPENMTGTPLMEMDGVIQYEAACGLVTQAMARGGPAITITNCVKHSYF
jgi:hypothetical protein